jgi:hypothetical protein
MQEGSTWKAIRLTQLQACPKKLSKNSSITFWTDHMYWILDHVNNVVTETTISSHNSWPKHHIQEPQETTWSSGRILRI